MYTVLAIVGVLGGLFAWLWSLVREVKTLKETLTLNEQDEKVKEWKDKISELSERIKEDERDYEEKRKRFDDGNPPGSGAV